VTSENTNDSNTAFDVQASKDALKKPCIALLFWAIEHALPDLGPNEKSAFGNFKGTLKLRLQNSRASGPRAGQRYLWEFMPYDCALQAGSFVLNAKLAEKTSEAASRAGSLRAAYSLLEYCWNESRLKSWSGEQDAKSAANHTSGQ